MSNAMDEPLVATAGLTKSYGPLTVLRDLHLTIPRGQRVALLGRSGSGKSTLLNLLGGLDVPSAGSIVVNGRDLGRMTPNQRADYRLTTVGMIFQSFNLVASRTAIENIEMPLVLAGMARSERRKQALASLDSMGLSERAGHLPAELSGGERQRVAIARALLNRPPLLLADEPTGNLDSTTGDEVVRLLLGYLESAGATLLLVTHDEELARRCANRIVRMQDGMILNT